jgi:hypothetical protein
MDGNTTAKCNAEALKAKETKIIVTIFLETSELENKKRATQ